MKDNYKFYTDGRGGIEEEFHLYCDECSEYITKNHNTVDNSLGDLCEKCNQKIEEDQNLNIES